MPDPNVEYYYVGDQKVMLNRLPDSFAVKYKEDVPTRDASMIGLFILFR